MDDLKTLLPELNPTQHKMLQRIIDEQVGEGRSFELQLIRKRALATLASDPRDGCIDPRSLMRHIDDRLAKLKQQEGKEV